MTAPRLAVVLALLVAAVSHAQVPAAGAPPRGPRAPRPALVVLITVDQMRADYLDRFGAQLDGGLGRLARGGARFTNAHHDHAITETAPGHATLLSGRFPRSTGIAANDAGVEDDAAPLLDGARGPGASPRRFRGTTLVDWLVARDPRSRALAVSAKDRGAILPVGRARQQVLWYTPAGRFTTSSYYAQKLPDWVRRFNDRDAPRRLAGRAWEPLLPARAYAEADTVVVEGAGYDVVFPHVMPADSAAAADYVRATPWMDSLVLDLALDGVGALALGRGPQTDVLSVSLSATDAIGHRYGPDSKEIHDQILRLDRSLGSFLDSLARLVGDSSRVAVALTADHGVGTVPELAPRGVTPRPVRADFTALAAATRDALRAAGVNVDAFESDARTITLDSAALRRAKADPAAVLAAVAAAARRTNGVRRVDRFRDLLTADTSADPIARRWLHQFPADAAVDLVVTLTPLSVWGRGVATHGSPYDYDSHVPLIFFGAAFRPGRYPEFVRTVDLAPTLAAAVGVAPLEAIDGRALTRALP